MTESQILNWISEGEHQRQDFKYKITDSLKLARTMSAFANTDGGRLLIGVRDDGSLSGVRSEEEMYMVRCAAEQYCKPVPEVSYSTSIVSGKTILVATVKESEKRPVKAFDEKDKLRAYIRIADENIIATPVHIDIWKEKASAKGVLIHYSEADKSVASILSENGLTLREVVKQTGVRRQHVIKILSRLTSYGLAQIQFNGVEFVYLTA